MSGMMLDGLPLCARCGLLAADHVASVTDCEGFVTPTEPTPEQGRVETREEWRNVYADSRSFDGEFRGVTFKSKQQADISAEDFAPEYPRIAIEKVTTLTRTERIDLGGEQ